VNPNETFDVIGNKDVIVYDPTSVKVLATPGTIIGVTGLVMHVLRPEEKFNLRTRTILIPG